MRRRLDLVSAVKEETASTSLESWILPASLPTVDLAQTTESGSESEKYPILDPEDEDLCALLEGTLNDKTASTTGGDYAY